MAEKKMNLEAEPENKWLKRVARDLQKQTPNFKTKKVVNGKTLLFPTNHFPRLKEINKAEGHEGVQRYVNEKIDLYNEQIREYRSKNKLRIIK